MIQAALFDLDGTIIDSMDTWLEEGIALLNKYQIPNAIEICTRLVPKSMVTTCEYVSQNFSLPVSKEMLIHEWEKIMEEHYETDIKLKTGIKEALMYLKNQGIHLGVTTATNVEMTKKVLTKLGVLSLFDQVYTTQMVGKNKDYPDVYLECADKFGLKAYECAVFEDAYHAIRTAKQAGFCVVAVDEPTMAPYIDIVRNYCNYYIYDYGEIQELDIFQ